MATTIRSKIPLNWLILLIVCTMVVIFSFMIVFSWFDSNLASPTKSLSREQIDLLNRGGVSRLVIPIFGQPVKLTIPTINVMAEVEFVGVTSDGSMDIPKGPANVAWYYLGPRPGEVGSAVISGHYGWKNNIPAVFDNLSKLKKGDQIYIEDEKGEIITFIVRESVVYGENDDAVSVFTSDDGKAHLNLVTCQGVWNKDKKSYSERLVVFTDEMNQNSSY